MITVVGCSRAKYLRKNSAFAVIPSQSRHRHYTYSVQVRAENRMGRNHTVFIYTLHIYHITIDLLNTILFLNIKSSSDCSSRCLRVSQGLFTDIMIVQVFLLLSVVISHSSAVPRGILMMYFLVLRLPLCFYNFALYRL